MVFKGGGGCPTGFFFGFCFQMGFHSQNHENALFLSYFDKKKNIKKS
jgi:hypothetical protein